MPNVVIDLESPHFVEGANAIMRIAAAKFCKHAFYSDLLYDLERISKMIAGETLYIAVREMGTSCYDEHEHADERAYEAPSDHFIVVKCEADKWNDLRWVIQDGTAQWFATEYHG